MAADRARYRLLRVQLEGKKASAVDDFLRGHQLIHAFLGNPS